MFLFSQEQKFLTSDSDEKFGTCILDCTYRLIEILLIVCQMHTTNMLHSFLRMLCCNSVLEDLDFGLWYQVFPNFYRRSCQELHMQLNDFLSLCSRQNAAI